MSGGATPGGPGIGVSPGAAIVSGPAAYRSVGVNAAAEAAYRVVERRAPLRYHAQMVSTAFAHLSQCGVAHWVCTSALTQGSFLHPPSDSTSAEVLADLRLYRFYRFYRLAGLSSGEAAEGGESSVGAQRAVTLTKITLTKVSPAR